MTQWNPLYLIISITGNWLSRIFKGLRQSFSTTTGQKHFILVALVRNS